MRHPQVAVSVLAGLALQKIIEWSGPAIEPFTIMVAGEQFDEGHLLIA